MRSARSLILLSIAMTTLSATVRGATWQGGDGGDWNADANWSTGSVPGAGDSVTVSSGQAIYDASLHGDWTVSGGAYTFNGGSFRQINSIAWMQIRESSTLSVGAGSVFDSGSADQVNVYPTASFSVTNASFLAKLVNNQSHFSIGGSSAVTVSGEFDVTTPTGSFTMSGSGTTTVGGQFLAQGDSFSVTGGHMTVGGQLLAQGNSFNLGGGSLTIAGEFHPQAASVTISGGTLKAQLLSFDGPGTIIHFSGGTIDLVHGADWEGGIYQTDASTHYIDYTSGSTGLIYLEGDDGTKAANLLQVGDVRYSGAIDAAQFSVATDSTGSYIRLSSVPEPASLALAGLSLLAFSSRRRRA